MSDTPTLPPPPTSLTLVPFPAPAVSASTSAKSDLEKGDSARTQSKRGAVTRKDRDRWRKWKDGQSPEEIATKEHSTVLRVNNSIQKVLSYQSSVSHEAVDMAANELAISTIQKMGQLIDDVLNAEKDKTIKDAEGKDQIITVPDLKMRLSVFDKITKLIQSVRKGDGLNINMNNNQTNVVVAGGGKGRSVEERIRALREKNHLKNEEDSANVVDAEFEDVDEEDEEEGGEDVETASEDEEVEAAKEE
jgi:hypothetical protein